MAAFPPIMFAVAVSDDLSEFNGVSAHGQCGHGGTRTTRFQYNPPQYDFAFGMPQATSNGTTCGDTVIRQRPGALQWQHASYTCTNRPSPRNKFITAAWTEFPHPFLYQRDPGTWSASSVRVEQ